VVFDLFTAEVRTLRVENLTATFYYLQLTLATAALTTTGRREEHTVLIKRRQN
jgi:hypothetical protein